MYSDTLNMTLDNNPICIQELAKYNDDINTLLLKFCVHGVDGHQLQIKPEFIDNISELSDIAAINLFQHRIAILVQRLDFILKREITVDMDLHTVNLYYTQFNTLLSSLKMIQANYKDKSLPINETILFYRSAANDPTADPKRGKPPQAKLLMREFPDLKQFTHYWDRSDLNANARMLPLWQELSNYLINIPYDDEPNRDIIRVGSSTVYHHNHDTTHAMRQFTYTEQCLDLIKTMGVAKWREAANSMTREESACVQLAAFLFRSGRTNESGHPNDTSYAKRSADIFAQVAQNLGFNASLIKSVKAGLYLHTAEIDYISKSDFIVASIDDINLVDLSNLKGNHIILTNNNKIYFIRNGKITKDRASGRLQELSISEQDRQNIPRQQLDPSNQNQLITLTKTELLTTSFKTIFDKYNIDQYESNGFKGDHAIEKTILASTILDISHRTDLFRCYLDSSKRKITEGIEKTLGLFLKGKTITSIATKQLIDYAERSLYETGTEFQSQLLASLKQPQQGFDPSLKTQITDNVQLGFTRLHTLPSVSSFFQNQPLADSLVYGITVENYNIYLCDVQHIERLIQHIATLQPPVQHALILTNSNQVYFFKDGAIEVDTNNQAISRSVDIDRTILPEIRDNYMQLPTNHPEAIEFIKQSIVRKTGRTILTQKEQFNLLCICTENFSNPNEQKIIQLILENGGHYLLFNQDRYKQTPMQKMIKFAMENNDFQMIWIALNCIKPKLLSLMKKISYYAGNSLLLTSPDLIENIFNQFKDEIRDFLSDEFNEQSMLNCMLEASLRNTEVVKFLIGKGADVNTDNSSAGSPKSSILMKCIYDEKEYNRKLLVYLLSKGADPYKEDGFKQSLWFFIAKHTLGADILEQIIQNSPQPVNYDLQNNNGDTLLHLAVSNGNIALVKKLISLGANPFIANKHGLRPIHALIIPSNNPNYLHEKKELYDQIITLLDPEGIERTRIQRLLGETTEHQWHVETYFQQLMPSYTPNLSPFYQHGKDAATTAIAKGKPTTSSIMPNSLIFTQVKQSSQEPLFTPRGDFPKTAWSTSPPPKSDPDILTSKKDVAWELLQLNTRKDMAKQLKTVATFDPQIQTLDASSPVVIHDIAGIPIPCIQLTSEENADFKFVVHTAPTAPLILQETLASGAHNITDNSPITSMSLINCVTPPCQGSHQGNLLPPVQLVFAVNPRAIQWTSATDCCSPTGDKIKEKLDYHKKTLFPAKAGFQQAESSFMQSLLDENNPTPPFSPALFREAMHQQPFYKPSQPYIAWNERGGTGVTPFLSPNQLLSETKDKYNEIIVGNTEKNSHDIELVGICIDQKDLATLKLRITEMSDLAEKPPEYYDMIQSLQCLQQYSTQYPIILIDIDASKNEEKLNTYQQMLEHQKQYVQLHLSFEANQIDHATFTEEKSKLIYNMQQLNNLLDPEHAKRRRRST